MKSQRFLGNGRPAGVAFLLLALLAHHAAASEGTIRPPLDDDTAVQFVQRARDYVSLRKAAVEETPQLEETSSPVEISAREGALASAIRAQRAGAKRGDLFDGAGAPIQALVREDWRGRPFAERAALWKEIPYIEVPAVNSAYPSSLPLATFPPALLTRLPELPEELEYRFAGPHLILRDVGANLVVDVLPNALSDPGTPRLGSEADQ